jgi:hypothetical protein
MKVVLLKTLGIVTGSKEVQDGAIDLNVGSRAMSFEFTEFWKDGVFVESIAKIMTAVRVTSSPTALGMVFDILKERSKAKTKNRKAGRKQSNSYN